MYICMGLKRVDLGVSALVKWVEKDRKKHSDIPLENYRVSLDVVNEKYFRFFHRPVIKGTVKYSKSDHVLNETVRSLYILPPLISPYANSRTNEMAERVGNILTEKGLVCEVECL
jgi:hypothetical protein